MTYSDSSASSLQSICNQFSQFFKNVYSKKTVHSTQTYEYNILDIASIYLTLQDFFESLLSIDTNKGSGPDYIHPLILKNCASTLARPLFYLFSFSLRSVKFPTGWKSSYTSPIFKSGSRTMVESYRGIAILPT